MSEKWRESEVNIAIDDKSQGSTAKHLMCAVERIFKIGEHLAKLQAKWLTVSYTPFALHFCPQRCRYRQRS